jgi:Ser/Thr protein kinase RdoA (MazF antagonist)
MPAATPTDPELIATHTTAATSSVVRWLERHYGLAAPQCHLIRRGLNDNYAVRAAEGARFVARLYSIRPRGGFNIDFETALLAHLQSQGAGVAASVPAAGGRPWVQLQFPEGPRALTLFQHAEGAVPETNEDFALTGRALARIHTAARSYAGPPSRYTLDGHHLAGRTLGYLATHPTIDAELAGTYRALAQRLLEQLAAAEDGLTRVVCHGDTHGHNNHVHTDEASGARKTVFFDFDDAGPGFLAYDLGVLPWSLLFRKALKEPDDALRERWTHYLAGYRADGAQLPERDIAAIPLFLQLRHLWNMGEALGRLHHWGTSAAPVDWLKKQLDMFEAWEKVELPVTP